jgi:hypothetical protein
MHAKFENKLSEQVFKEAADHNRAILNQLLSIMEDEELPEMESMIRWIIYNVSQLDDIEIAHMQLTISTPKEDFAETEIETDDEDVEEYPEEESLEDDEITGNSFTLKLFHLHSLNYNVAQPHCYFQLSGELTDENVYNLHNYDNSEIVEELIDSLDGLYPYFVNLVTLTFPILEHLLENSTSVEVQGNYSEGNIRQFSFDTDHAKYEVWIDVGFLFELQAKINGETDEHSEAD